MILTRYCFNTGDGSAPAGLALLRKDYIIQVSSLLQLIDNDFDKILF